MLDWTEIRQDLFDPRKVPFSRRGSFMAITWIEEDGAFWLRNLRGGDEGTDLGRMLRLQVLSEDQVDWSLAPDCLTASTVKGQLRFVFDGAARLHLQGSGLGLRLSAGQGKYNYAQGDHQAVHICIARQDLRCNVTLAQGRISLNTNWDGLTSDRIEIDLSQDVIDATLDFFSIDPIPCPKRHADAARAAVAAEFSVFRETLPKVPDTFALGHLLASYILWSGYVPAEGVLSLPAIYMSKNWMTNIWSWDHCFVALGLGQRPELAFEQMQVIYNAQSVSGRLPDFINDRNAYWAFTKPPVHGWTFSQLRAMAPHFYDAAKMRQILDWLKRQLGFWLAGPQWHGLPAYRHGNDAGWDNASCFAEGGPLVGPDLATFLVLQLDEIATLHQALGQHVEAAEAHLQADALCDALCRELWQGEGFVARLQVNGDIVTTGQSLLLYIPLLLGKRLAPQIREALLVRLLKPGLHLTEHGLATEALPSGLYRENGYWRGPIWAPTTALFVDALRRCDQPEAAMEISRRYCAMCNSSGMAENFDAQTGLGLHDPAFAWTSAVFLLLGNQLF